MPATPRPQRGPTSSRPAETRTASALNRLLAAAAVMAAALLIAACGDSGDTTTETVTTSETSATAPDSTGTVPEDAESDGAAVTDDQSEVEGATTSADDTVATTTETPTTEQPDDLSGTSLPPVATTTTEPTTDAPPVVSSIGSTSTGAVLSRPFATSSPWNTDISNDPVDPESRELMRRAQKLLTTVARPNGEITTVRQRIDVGLTTNVTRWTVPIFSDNQPGAVPRVTVCRQLSCGEDATTSIVMPEEACPDPRYDGWMTVLDTGARIAYDFWRARCEADGSISYQFVTPWDLDGPGYQKPGGVSVRGSGVPLFAGLITPEEIAAGRIDHALAISVPGAAQRRYVQPASRTDGTGAASSLPEGARLRLRGGSDKLLTRTFIRNGTERDAAETIVAALERYGAIVVDRAAAPTMYAQRNADWEGILPLNLLQDIPLSRFDVIQLDEIRLFPPNGVGAATVPSGTPGSIPGTSSGSQGATGYTTPEPAPGQVVTP